MSRLFHDFQTDANARRDLARRADSSAEFETWGEILDEVCTVYFAHRDRECQDNDPDSLRWSTRAEIIGAVITGNNAARVMSADELAVAIGGEAFDRFQDRQSEAIA